VTRPLKPATDRREINQSRLRIRDLERRVPAGDWVYVGNYPSDLRTTPDSPPFQNGWFNSGDGTPGTDELTKFRWKIGLGAEITMHVNVDGGDPGTVIFTLPADYWPASGKQTLDCTDADGNFACVTVVPRSDGSNMADVYQGRV
jgi:hypothetical protein